MTNTIDNYKRDIIGHYAAIFNTNFSFCYLPNFSAGKLPAGFQILEFPPKVGIDMWTYATCCMSQPFDDERIELHIHSANKDESIVELLTAVTFYHRTANSLSLNHTVNFGRPWQRDSKCDHGFVSLPYLFGPTLEDFRSVNGLIKFYWLLPVTKREVEYKKRNGVDALESLFDSPLFNYLNPARASVV